MIARIPALHMYIPLLDLDSKETYENKIRFWVIQIPSTKTGYLEYHTVTLFAFITHEATVERKMSCTSILTTPFGYKERT